MKRRALLLGALLMPTAAHAQPKRPATRAIKRQTAKPKVQPVAAAPRGLKEAKTQLVAFDASPFPYRGFIPDTNKPFLDKREGGKRGHGGKKPYRRPS